MGPRRCSLTLLVALAVVGCRSSEEAPRPSVGALDEAAAHAALETYAEIAWRAYGDSLELARTLETAVASFLAAPSEQTLDAAREAWLRARVPYVQTEVYRFYDGPIDGVEPWINSWPIDENFVDSSAAGSAPGLIGDRAGHPELSEAHLLALNAQASETSISTGYHVIEFLLWGQDQSADGPGDRSHLDYVVARHASAGAEATQARALVERRAAYLRTLCALLVKHLDQVAAAWEPRRSDNYRSQLLRMPPRAALGRVLKGMGSLSGPELAGERLTVAYATKDQENEHSCFSDSTHVDMFGDALGIENVCLGRYRGAGGEYTGTGICSLVSAADRALGQRLTAEISRSVEAARRIPAPFDRAVLGADSAPGRVAILETIRALEGQATSIARAAALLGADLGLASARASKS
jgi:putative iron-regulated protein